MDYLNLILIQQWFQFQKIKKIFLLLLKLNEGDIYKVKEVKLAGDLDIEEFFVRSLINIPTNEIYMEGFFKFSEDRITNLLENFGYTNAEVSTSKRYQRRRKNCCS